MIPYEFEVKEIVKSKGVRVEPYCIVASNSNTALEECLSEISPPYVVKAQVRGWGRAKAGLVKFAEDREEARRGVAELFARTFGGAPIRYVMVSKRLGILRELYLSVMVNYAPPYILLLASRSGGVEVEEQASRDGVLRIKIDPFEGVRDYMVRYISKFLDVPLDPLRGILEGLYSAIWDYNLHLLELNPLAVTENGIIALDAKAIVDDDALEQNPRLGEIRSRYESELTDEEALARKMGFSVVLLNGDTAVIGNGAGLTMATLDALVSLGGSPGLFLDLGGGASAERVKAAMSLVLGKLSIKRVLVNILGGITRCDEVAKGVVEALKESGRRDMKIVFRLSGFREEEGRRILEDYGIRAFKSFEDAVREVVR
ncbi:succinate--CoA ligase subunit beta [Infirmifilum lucidum]|uniref:Succinate--CoA ligase subunit beta n=1 Tax=Infirmifilum lucidum TaxID=2776706 RepID=A0A7L9FEK4_9CREN|nr:succinate--CoA ligase subunit beta [Infirmifilum lucidum]QOJ78169.1 succinate--CoA ligase subunit beta [Infirmifilum lucidum]